MVALALAYSTLRRGGDGTLSVVVVVSPSFTVETSFRGSRVAGRLTEAAERTESLLRIACCITYTN